MELIEKVFGVDHPIACQTREELLELEAKINQLEAK
jgi:BMFP domain-containing protein YqiC